jgi:Methyltransferase domain
VRRRAQAVKVTRAQVVQRFLSLYESPGYLEVGVSKGATFHEVVAARKVGVDPRLRFKVTEAQGVEYHEVGSDTYFGEIADPADRFDVIYLDGLHTLEQTLRDFTNALAFLSPAGVIVIDDVYPSSYVAALPDIDEHRAVRRELGVTSGAWMGDVYRLVFLIDTFFQQLTYRTVADNHGQLVVWAQRRSDTPRRRVAEIAELPYERIVLDRAPFNFAPLATIVEEVRSATRPAARSSPGDGR